MSFYVQRYRTTDQRMGWTGPIRSERQAYRERDAWLSVEGWDAVVVESTPRVRAEVRDWTRHRRSE
jgi:hypothetical protein